VQDIPPEISVALDVYKALCASGRCREDVDLHASSTALLNQFLMQALAGAPQLARPDVPPGRAAR